MTTRTEIKKALLKAFRAEKLVCRFPNSPRLASREWQKSPYDAGIFKAANKGYSFWMMGELVSMFCFGMTHPVEWKINN
jgi:hypothetical protein